MQVFVTKYALSKGILGGELEHQIGNIASININGKTEFCRGEGEEWHKTIESAKLAAVRMRDQQIKFLKRRLSRMQNLIFL